MSTRIPELVLPAGDRHRAQIAFMYGADAVYLGLDRNSLRKAEVRFTEAEINKTIAEAHAMDKKVYITFNIFAHEGQLAGIEKDLEKLSAYEPDAYIISDPGIIHLARKVAPKVPIHLSTQANTLNSAALKFWGEQGVKRVVLGREATLADIKKIKKAAPEMEIEIFAHGAMCISYSGRCLISAALTGRSANLGSCTQPCRWNYNIYLEEPSRPGELMTVEESTEGTYLMSSKDLCTVEHLDKIAAAGVDAIKIEGRNKTDYYVATVARAYKEALDLISKGKYTETKKKSAKKELESLTRRGYTTGFLLGEAKGGETYPGRQPIYGKRYLGYVENVNKEGWATIVVKNKIELDKEYECLTPQGIQKIKVECIEDSGAEVSVANPGAKDKRVTIETAAELTCYTFLRELE